MGLTGQGDEVRKASNGRRVTSDMAMLQQLRQYLQFQESSQLSMQCSDRSRASAVFSQARCTVLSI